MFFVLVELSRGARAPINLIASGYCHTVAIILKNSPIPKSNKNREAGFKLEFLCLTVALIPLILAKPTRQSY